MKPFAFRSALQVLLPAALLLASCSKKDEPTPTPAPDQGRVVVYNAAVAAAPLTFFAGEQQFTQLSYGQNSSYTVVNAGAPVFRINNGTQLVNSLPVTIAKNQSYTVFAYSPNATIGSAMLLPVSDDLTTPLANQAKVRVVHLGVNVTGSVRLTAASPVIGSIGTDISGDVAFASSSSFFPVTAGPANLVITSVDAPRMQLLVVGDGTGTGTGTKNYEAGKIYTIVVRGINGSGVPDAQALKTFLMPNN